MPTVSFGDAVSNDARAIGKVIEEMGYKTGIYAENIAPKLNDPSVHKLSKLPSTDKNDIIIFNHSTGTELCYSLPDIPGRKMMIYHNITPPKFFERYSPAATKTTTFGYRGTEFLSDKIEYAMADSSFNADDLRRMGYTCPIDVRPILIPFDDYKKTPDQAVISKYSGDGFVNIVFVGRIAPNKKQEDCISAFAYYQKHINPKSRLIFVGSDSGMETYGDCLKKYADALMLENVIFTGHVSFPAILAYYKLADVFLCMSEHEGFCVPLIEAMCFETPVIAYNSCAVPETLGGSGVLLRDKDPVFCAHVIDRVVRDGELRAALISTQNKRLADFSYENVRAVFEKCLDNFINKR